MERTKNTKMLRKEKPITRKGKIFIENINIYVTFKKIPSLSLPCTAVYIGKVKALVYCERKVSTSKPFIIQSYLPDIRTFIGEYPTEQKCKEICLKVVKMFIDKLENSIDHEK